MTRTQEAKIAYGKEVKVATAEAGERLIAEYLAKHPAEKLAVYVAASAPTWKEYLAVHRAA